MGIPNRNVEGQKLGQIMMVASADALVPPLISYLRREVLETAEASFRLPKDDLNNSFLR